MSETTPESNQRRILRELRDQFTGRAKEQGWKKGTARHQKHQLEFFIGAHAACLAAGFPGFSMVLISLSFGHNIEDLVKD